MGKDTKIEWCLHTFNPWWGCVKVSTGCENCYAETFSKRTGHTVWGPAKTTSRRLFGHKHWAEPLKWNEVAQQAGERHRVFCASMADVFEDHPQVVEARLRLFELIDRTPHLDWLLLTKRPENIQRLWPFSWYDDQYVWPNIWLGTSVENQAAADARIPHLLRIPAAVRFLSCEPLLGPVDLTCVDDCLGLDPEGYQQLNVLQGFSYDAGYGDYGGRVQQIRWVIVGGESGPYARPMQPQWVRNLRDQCRQAGVPFFFKQWGHHWPVPHNTPTADPRSFYEDGQWFVPMGKGAAGRGLDGEIWNQFPQNTQEIAHDAA